MIKKNEGEREKRKGVGTLRLVGRERGREVVGGRSGKTYLGSNYEPAHLMSLRETDDTCYHLGSKFTSRRSFVRGSPHVVASVHEEDTAASLQYKAGFGEECSRTRKKCSDVIRCWLFVGVAIVVGEARGAVVLC